MLTKNLFLEHFYETLKELINDPIINVQIAIAKCLYKHSLKGGFIYLSCLITNIGSMADTDEFKNLIILLSKHNSKEI